MDQNKKRYFLALIQHEQWLISNDNGELKPILYVEIYKITRSYQHVVYSYKEVGEV